MKKSLIALLLVVALVVTVSVFAASAETPNPFEDQIGEVVEDCPYCGVCQTWYPVQVAEANYQMKNWASTKNGATHFYYTCDMVDGSSDILTNETFCINLNGKTVTRKSGETFIIEGADAATAPVLNILDTSVGQTGSIDAGAVSGNNFFHAKGTGTVNVYSGTIYGPGSKIAAGSGNNPTLIQSTEDSSVTFNFLGGTLMGHSQWSNGMMKIIGSTVVNIDGATLDGKGGTNTILVSGANAKLYLKSGSLTVGSMSAGKVGRILVENGALFEMTGGTLTGSNSSTGSLGGAIALMKGEVNLYGGTITGTCPEAGAILVGDSNAKLTLDGATIKDSSSTAAAANQKGGGAVKVTYGTFTMKSGTIENCSATSHGGAVLLTGGTFNMEGGTIKNCSATQGGAVYTSGSSAKFLMTGGTIEDCSATNGGAVFVQYRSHANALNGGTIKNCTATYGGALALSGSGTDADGYPTITINDVLIENCSANQGGAAWIEDQGILNMAGGQIKDCVATETIGGGVAVYAGAADKTPKMFMTGGTISGCDAATWGGNIALSCNTSKANTKPEFTMSGTAVLDGTDSVVTASAKGQNIGVTYGVATVNGGELIDGNICVNSSDKAELNLNGGKFTDNDAKGSNPGTWFRMFLLGRPQNLTGTVNFGKNFSAKLSIDFWANDELDTDYKAGTVLDIALADNFAGDLEVFAMDKTSSAIPVILSENKLVITNLVGIDDQEALHPVAAVSDDYKVFRLYNTTAFTLTQDTCLDLNNCVVDITTGQYKLYAVDFRTDGFVDAKFTKFTVDNEENLERVVRHPINGYQYINLKGADGTWTSNRVKVDIDAVNIKPATAALYYTTNMDTNPLATALVKKYGVVLSLADMPAADFVADLNDAGETENLWTEITFALGEEETRMAIKGANSALLEDILIKDAPAGQNKTWGEMPIYANAYVCFEIDGKEVYVMADETYDLSLLDILSIVDSDETLASHPSVVKMYNTWQDPMAQWKLPNIAAAANA